MTNEFKQDSYRVRVRKDKAGDLYYCLYDITHSLKMRNGKGIKDFIERSFKSKLKKFKLDGDSYSFLTQEQLEHFLRLYSTSSKFNAFMREIPYRYKSYMAKQEIAKESQKPKVEVEVPSVVEKEVVSTNVDVKLFNFEMFDVETLFENSTPYFKLTDIEKVLGLTKGQSAKWIKDGWFDEDEVKLRNSQLGGHPLKYVAESGLYRILNRTNSPKARPFERWVTKEVLPSLRKNIDVIAKDKYLPQCRENCLQTFAYNGGNLDYGLLNNEPVFNLNYIGALLKMTNPRMSIDINDRDYVVKIDNSVVSFTYNRILNNRGELFLTEAGLYRLLLRSNSPKAEPFSKWVTKEVLPSLRKNGGYIANQENMTPEQIVANALIVAQNIINSQNQTIEYQGEKLNDYKAVEKTRRSKMELAKAINKNVKLLAEQKFNKQYANAYNYIYSIFASHHNISVPIDMNYLKKNNDYLEEVLRIVLAELD